MSIFRCSVPMASEDRIVSQNREPSIDLCERGLSCLSSLDVIVGKAGPIIRQGINRILLQDMRVNILLVHPLFLKAISSRLF